MNAFFWLLVGHFLADYPLQGDWMARAKNYRNPPIPGEMIWPTVLFGHALIHAGFVYIFTGSWALATVELFGHMLIDGMKIEETISYNQDQLAHIVMKAVYAALITKGLV